MRLITREQQEEAGRHAMKGFAIGAAQWGCIGIFATTVASAFFPSFRKVPLQNKVSILGRVYNDSEVPANADDCSFIYAWRSV